MNFNLVTQDKSSFTLFNGSTEIGTIKYNPHSQSIRLNSTERRVFFLELVGFLQNKILLKSEYGVEIGENFHIKQHKGILHLAKDKFSYRVEKDALSIYDKRKKTMINVVLDNANALASQTVSALVFSLAWLWNTAELNGATAHKASALYVS